jgi:hypothetical protein
VPTMTELGSQADKLLRELGKRAAKSRTLNRFYDGCPPFPQAVIEAKLTKTYGKVMPIAQAPWATVPVDSVLDRLEVDGIRTDDKAAGEALWRVWQANSMDAESKLGHTEALIDGRVFATVWRTEGTDDPEIVLDSAEQMIVQYREGSRRHRVAALRRWTDDDDHQHFTLYRPDGLYKFSAATEQTRGSGRIRAGEMWWERRDVDAEDGWPVPNPWRVVPVVEIAVNRRLKPGSFGYARGEFEHCTGLLSRIDLLTFIGLVVAIWMGFPLRYMTGDPIEWLKDDQGKPLRPMPPFESRPDSVVQLENPEAKIGQLEAADRGNLSIFAELSQLAYVTKTPAHYFPLETGLSNLSEDAIRALEGGLHAKVTGHKASAGEGWEEVLRLAGLMLDQRVILPPTAQLTWKDHESRSMAERADAATKLKDILPWQILAEEYLNLSQDQLARASAARVDDVLATLLGGAHAQPTPGEPALNGAGGA